MQYPPWPTVLPSSLHPFRVGSGHVGQVVLPTAVRSQVLTVLQRVAPLCCAALNQRSTSMSPRTLALLAFASLAASAPSVNPSASTVNKRYLEERNGVTYNVFKRAGEASSLSYVKNSGICETTPGVDQYSGYLDVGTDMHSKQDSGDSPLLLALFYFGSIDVSCSRYQDLEMFSHDLLGAMHSKVTTEILTMLC